MLPRKKNGFHLVQDTTITPGRDGLGEQKRTLLLGFCQEFYELGTGGRFYASIKLGRLDQQRRQHSLVQRSTGQNNNVLTLSSHSAGRHL